MNVFNHCEACPSRGNCIVERTNHRPYCDWAASGKPAYVARVVELSSDDTVPQFPSLATTISNAAGAANRVVHAALQGKTILESDEVYGERMAICRECPQYDAAKVKCRSCGCSLQLKARLRSEAGRCPLKKW